MVVRSHHCDVDRCQPILADTLGLTSDAKGTLVLHHHLAARFCITRVLRVPLLEPLLTVLQQRQRIVPRRNQVLLMQVCKPATPGMQPVNVCQ